jgi:hypothetical protein
MSDIKRENLTYEKFSHSHPITYQEILNLHNLDIHKNNTQLVFLFSSYQTEIEQLFYTRDQKIIRDIGFGLNNIGGFELMAYVVDLLRIIIERKTQNPNFLYHPRIIEMASNY